MKTLKRLEQMLDQKDERIEELETELQKLTDESERTWEWARHRTLKTNPDNLPVPRLEMRWHQETEDGYLQRYDYSLIYRHTLGHLVMIPLGQTRTQGGKGPPPIYNGQLYTPFRDGVHICNDSQQLGIPAFCIIGDKIARVFLKDDVCAQEPYAPTPGIEPENRKP